MTLGFPLMAGRIYAVVTLLMTMIASNVPAFVRYVEEKSLFLYLFPYRRSSLSLFYAY